MLHPEMRDYLNLEIDKVAVTGSHGTGKTTLLTDLERMIASGHVSLPEGLAIRFLPEQATRIRELFNDPNRLTPDQITRLGDLFNNPNILTTDNSPRIQSIIQGTQVQQETKALNEIARDKHFRRLGPEVGHVVLLTDRTVLDPESYLKVLFPYSQSYTGSPLPYPQHSHHILKQYRGVAVLPTGEFPITDSGGGLRSTDDGLQFEIDQQIRVDYSAAGIPLTEITGTRSERVHQLVDFILSSIKQDNPYEGFETIYVNPLD